MTTGTTATGRRVSILGQNIGILLCWMRQHLETHEHTAERLLATLLEGLPDNDEEMGFPVFCLIADSCWDDLVAFLDRHRVDVQELPEGAWPAPDKPLFALIPRLYPDRML